MGTLDIVPIKTRRYNILDTNLTADGGNGCFAARRGGCLSVDGRNDNQGKEKVLGNGHGIEDKCNQEERGGSRV